jgi:hypothetical protein
MRKPHLMIEMRPHASGQPWPEVVFPGSAMKLPNLGHPDLWLGEWFALRGWAG